MPDENRNSEEPIIRDKRRIDPVTGEVRYNDWDATANTVASPTPEVEGSEPEAAATARANETSQLDGSRPNDASQLDNSSELGGGDQLTVDDILNAANAEVQDPSQEHLADLKRVTAEYANYRKRTEANRELERERAVGVAVAALLPVLDDLDRAEKHGDLVPDSAFATIAAKLRSATERLGLVRFGAVGDAFDPQLHEAIFQQPDAAVTSETVVDVVETGYALGSVQLRPAKVVVATPTS